MTPLKICAFETRRGPDMMSLIERQGDLPTVVPSMCEVPLEENLAALSFGQSLLAGEFDVVVFLTGVGVRALFDVLESRFSRHELLQALDRPIVIVRGPKPAAVLREWKVQFDHQVREPNTWRELIELLDEKLPLTGKRVAVQEYGLPSDELYAALQHRGALVTPVPVYRWSLPDEVAPLENAIRKTIANEYDVLMWTSSFQLTAVMTIAERLGLKSQWLAAANRCVIASIGPTATENLTASGLPPDIEPDHPKMGHLVLAVSQRAREILSQKRTASRNNLK